MSTSPNCNQLHFRVRTDAGAVDGTPTWGAAEDVDYYPGLETNFRVRFLVQNSGTGASGIMVLRSSKNGAAYAAVTTGSTNGIQSVNAGSDTDGTAIATANFRLTAGAGVAEAGEYDETGATAATTGAGGYSEYEYGVILKTANLVAADVVDLEVYNNTTAFTTYTKIPRLTVPETQGSFFGTANKLGATGSTASNQSSLSLTTTAAASAGQLVIVLVACDNNQTTDGDESAVTSLTVNGESATKGVEFTNGQGSAQAGATCGVWWVVLAGDAAAASTITANFSNNTSRDATAISARAFTVAAGLTVAVNGTPGTLANDGADPGSLNVTTANVECLRVRATATEYTGAVTAEAAHTSTWGFFEKGSGSTGTSATSMSVYGECIISTGTGSASDPTIAAVDCASVYIAFTAIKKITAVKFDNTNTYGVATIGRGAVNITGVKFSSATATYGTATIGRGAVNITGIKFDSTNTYGAATVTNVTPITAVKFDNVNTFGTATIGRGPVNITGVKFSSATASYGVATIGRGSVNITGVIFTSSTNSYGAAVVGRGAVNITAVKFDNASTYGVAVIGQGSVSQNIDAVKFDNTSTYGSATIEQTPPVSQNIATTLFVNANTFGSATVIGPPQYITATHWFNTSTIYKSRILGAHAPPPGGLGPLPPAQLRKVNINRMIQHLAWWYRPPHPGN